MRRSIGGIVYRHGTDGVVTDNYVIDSDEAVEPPTPPAPPAVTRPFFAAADWLWNPIPANPVLDPQSANIAGVLATQDHSLIVDQFAAKIVHPSEVTTSTPRYAITVKNATGGSSGQNWGPSPFAGYSMPIPNGTESLIPPGDGSYFDGHVAIGDPAQNVAACMWQAEKVGGVWRCSWGGKTALDGDGREFPATGISTGSGLSRFGAVIRESEVAAGVIPHALFFGSNAVTLRGSGPVEGVNYRYPATTTDADSSTGTAFTIMEGARVRLNPNAVLGAGASPIETMIFNCLKTYGAYCGDETTGNARMAFVLERKPGSTVYANAGVFDYLNMTRIPWGQLQVLRSWNGV